MMIDTSPWSSCSRWSPRLACSGHTISSTGPSVSTFRDFSPGCQNVDKDGKAGKNYKGSVAKTISGKECQKWSEQKPQKHGFGDVGDHNFCRNPEYNEGVWGAVWCYTTDTKTRWEACDVPKCDIGRILQKYNFGLFNQILITSPLA